MLKNCLQIRRAVFACTLVALVSIDSTSAMPAASDVGLRAAGDACAEGIVSRLYFGQTTPAGIVTEAQWRSFVLESVTPRFPSGFTELQARGRWRDGRGAMIDEATRIVEIAHDGAPVSNALVRVVAADYKSRFEQQSVLVTQFTSFQCF
jgi:hypothetical protein